MKNTPPSVLSVAACAAIFALTMGGAADMTPAETSIAEEGFTFGLPIVMNYAVM
jgi:hypothetical protein